MVIHATPAPAPTLKTVASAPEESAQTASADTSSAALLQSLTLKELRLRAAAEGVDEDAIEDARDGDSPKEDVRPPRP